MFVQRLELGRTFSRVPGADAAQAFIAVTGLPHRTQLPAERGADDLQHAVEDLDRLVSFGKDSRNGVLHSLQIGGGRTEASRTGAHFSLSTPVRALAVGLTGGSVRRDGPLRIVVADDSALLREGIASLLEDAGHEVVGRSGSADDLLLQVASLARTSPSSMCGCLPATRTTDSSRPSRSGVRAPAWRYWFSRSTWSPRTCSSSSVTVRKAWATS